MSATSSEEARAIAAVSAKGRNISPVCPPTKIIGTNTAIVVSVEAVMAPATSETAPMIEANFVPPWEWRRRIASMTTIESSTTRPIEIVSAEIVSIFRL